MTSSFVLIVTSFYLTAGLFTVFFYFLDKKYRKASRTK